VHTQASRVGRLCCLLTRAGCRVQAFCGGSTIRRRINLILNISPSQGIYFLAPARLTTFWHLCYTLIHLCPGTLLLGASRLRQGGRDAVARRRVRDPFLIPAYLPGTGERSACDPGTRAGRSVCKPPTRGAVVSLIRAGSPAANALADLVSESEDPVCSRLPEQQAAGGCGPGG